MNFLPQKPDCQSFPSLYFTIFSGLIAIAACFMPFSTSMASKTAAQFSLASTHPWFAKQALNPLTFERTWTARLTGDLETWTPIRMGAVAASLSTKRPWPQIHQQARLAKVPVIMYHDVLPQKEVFFDVTPQKLAADFELIKAQGLTPISLDQLVTHLQTGAPLPEKPILLTFDDGYGGHYHYVYPLLQKYGYPAVFSIYTNKMNLKTGRTSVTWEQLKEMAANPLVTIASHSVSHPEDLRALSDDALYREIIGSKRLLEKKLGIPIEYFTYPAGRADARVKQWVVSAGYRAALSMSDRDEKFAGESNNLLAIERFGQSRLGQVIPQAWGGTDLPRNQGVMDFTTPITQKRQRINGISIILITGGRPSTIHAQKRAQVPQIVQGTGAIAAVDGGFFSLKSLDSNVMVGPVLTQQGQQFTPGNEADNRKLLGRPLVLIGANTVKFVPFDPHWHNTLFGLFAEMEETELLTDAFVGAAWLVKNGQPQPAQTFNHLFGFDAPRYRAFWGINQAGQPVIGASTNSVDAVSLGQALYKLGLRDAVMLDSGASTSLVFQGKSLVNHEPRPVPHVVALYPSYLAYSSPNEYIQANW
jgi:biofilm PGA synthesis lipoprotein PgaB